MVLQHFVGLIAAIRGRLADMIMIASGYLGVRMSDGDLMCH